MSATIANYRNNQEIKVFISSTFRDLEKERDYLVKHVFHTLQEKLGGVHIAPIDLRWGITDEQAHNGRVVDLCLRYLYESRPFIIGILGDRYGSSFRANEVQLSPLVASVYPNAMQQLSDGLSITEIEIINGALDSQEDDVNAFFLVKDSHAPYPNESIAQYEKLQALKQRVLSQQKYPVMRYSDLADIEQIIKPLEDAIRKKFDIPKRDIKSVFLSIDHPGLEVMRNMSKRRDLYKSVYPEDIDLLYNLGEFIEEGNPCSIIEGAPGIGKSTLLAHFERKHSRLNRHFLYIYGDEQSLPLSDKQFFDFLFVSAKRVLQEDTPDEFKDDACLISAISRSKWCFVIDNTDTDFCNNDIPFHHLPAIILSVSQWMNKEYGTELDYKILYVQSTDSKSTLPDSNNMPHYRIHCSQHFSPSKVLTNYLASYFKNLDPLVLAEITSSPAAHIPGALLLIGDYLRENIKHEELVPFAQKVSKLTCYEEVIHLYLEELLKECDKEDVAKIVTLLGVFKSGLNRTELQELSHIDTLSFNICLSYLEKFMSQQYDGRLHFKNHFTQNCLFKAFSITEAQLSNAAQKHFDYFWNKVKDLNHTQEDFRIESSKNFWMLYTQWMHIIPDWVFLHYPQNGQLPFEDKSNKVRRWLNLCGGMSYENTCKAFFQFKVSTATSLLSHTSYIHSQQAKGKITQEEARERLNFFNTPLPQNPARTDVLHLYESALTMKLVGLLWKLATNPVFVNRILNTGTLTGVWRWLRGHGVPLCEEGVLKNTLFSETAFRNIAMMLGDTEAVEYYTNDQSRSLYTITLPKLPVLQRTLRLFSVYKDDFKLLQQPHQITKYDNGRWVGDVDFFGKANGYGIYIWDDFNIYVGEFKHGKKHGKGCFYYNDNNRYDGEWKKDVKEGHGTLTYTDGNKYVGDFKNNMMHGTGCYYFKSGEIYEGNFKKNCLNGTGCVRWSDGSWMTGKWENGTLIPGTRQDHKN